MEQELVDLMRAAAPEGIGIFRARMLTMADGFHFEVELDGLHDPRGAVTLDDCEAFSRRFVERLDREIEALQTTQTEWAAVIPEGITVDNYSLEVSSAGAERELRLPDELERFRGQPLKLRRRVPDATRGHADDAELSDPAEKSGAEANAANLSEELSVPTPWPLDAAGSDAGPRRERVDVRVVVYDRRETVDQEEVFVFTDYAPTGRRARRQERAKKKRRGKNAPGGLAAPDSAADREIRVRAADLRKANLYLDF